LRTYAGTTTYSAKDRGGNGLFVFDQTLDVQLDRLVRRSVSSRVDPGATQPGECGEYAERLLPAFSMTVQESTQD